MSRALRWALGAVLAVTAFITILHHHRTAAALSSPPLPPPLPPPSLLSHPPDPLPTEEADTQSPAPTADTIYTPQVKYRPPFASSDLPASCRAGDDQRFTSFLSNYLNSNQTAPRFIYSCEPHIRKRFCGGTGDRLRGIISSFYLALVTRRRFKIYSPYPAPLYSFYQPAYVDWAVLKEEEVRSIPVDMSLMRLNRHAHYMRELAKAKGDVRVQSNSFDPTPYAYDVPALRHGMEEMGLGRQCNISCFYSCLFDLLFTPNPRALAKIEETVRGRTPFISMQVRVSGKWAVGLAIPEKWRTHPEALPHFWEALEEQFALNASRRHVFITTDAPRFIELAQERYKDRVFVTPGNQFNHTDSSELHALRPAKFRANDDPVTKREKFELTLLNNYVLGMAEHMIMGQSGFGDTAFWRTKRTATCLFVDIDNYRHLWRHRLVYPHPMRSVRKVDNKIIKVPPPAS